MVVFVFAVLGVMAQYINPNDNYFFTYASLGLPFVLTLAVLIFVYTALKKSWFFIVPLLTLAINYQFITSYIGFGGLFNMKETTGNFKIKVATYNVHGFNYCEGYVPINDIADYIQNESVDILCMQEYMPHYMYSDKELRSAFWYLENQYIRTSSLDVIGLAIYSKYPIKNNGTVNFPQSANGAIWADVILPDSSIVRVINVHMQTTGVNKGYRLGISGTIINLSDNAKTRAQQAHLIETLIDNTKHPIILAGDFNDIPSSYTFNILKGDLNDNFKQGGIGPGGTFKGKFSFLRLDNILSSNEFVCKKYFCSSKEWSDHFPVIAEFEMIGDDQ